MPWNPDYYYQNINWKTGLAAERARHNLKLKKKKAAGPKRQATSSKRQAASLTNTNSRIIKDI